MAKGSVSRGSEDRTKRRSPVIGPSSDRSRKPEAFRRSWGSSGPVAKLTLISGSVAAIAAVASLISYIGVSVRQDSQADAHFKVEHRPRIVFSHPPELLGRVSCGISEKEMHVRLGQQRVWLKNIRNGDAPSVFVWSRPHISPAKTTGDKILDERPNVTDDTCTQQEFPQTRVFVLNAGEEKSVDIQFGLGITANGPIKMPIFGPAVDISGKVDSSVKGFLGPNGAVLVKSDARVQLFIPLCVSYVDEDGARHATCNLFGLVTPNGANTFSCLDPPQGGTLRELLFNSCEK
jgi:hypothetical protein